VQCTIFLFTGGVKYPALLKPDKLTRVNLLNLSIAISWKTEYFRIKVQQRQAFSLRICVNVLLWADKLRCALIKRRVFHLSFFKKRLDSGGFVLSNFFELFFIELLTRVNPR